MIQHRAPLRAAYTEEWKRRFVSYTDIGDLDDEPVRRLVMARTVKNIMSGKDDSIKSARLAAEVTKMIRNQDSCGWIIIEVPGARENSYPKIMAEEIKELP